jgi:hypothetical protein
MLQRYNNVLQYKDQSMENTMEFLNRDLILKIKIDLNNVFFFINLVQ